VFTEAATPLPPPRGSDIRSEHSSLYSVREGTANHPSAAYTGGSLYGIRVRHKMLSHPDTNELKLALCCCVWNRDIDAFLRKQIRQ
jgi:hypothetical protein